MSSWKSYRTRFKQFLLLEKGLSANSIEAYLDDVHKLEQYAGSTLAGQLPTAFSYRQLQDFVEWAALLGFSAATQARIVSGIKTFYKFLVLEEELSNNPAALLETPKIARKLPVFLSVPEIDAMLACIDRSKAEGERNYSMLETLYSCGLRVSELVNLKITDLHLEQDYIKVTGKGSKERLVPIGRSAKK